MPHLPGGLRSPRALRQSPIDPFQQICQLRRRDRHRPIRAVVRNGRWPDKTAAFQPLREQAQALAVVPQHLDQGAAPAAEHEQMAIVGIAPERLLYQQRQSIEALAHVSVAGRQPHLHAARKWDHWRLAFASAVTIAAIVEASTGPVIRIRVPVANSISIVPGGIASAGAAETCPVASLSALLTSAICLAKSGARCFRNRRSCSFCVEARLRVL